MEKVARSTTAHVHCAVNEPIAGFGHFVYEKNRRISSSEGDTSFLVAVFACRSMISKHLIIASTCFLLGTIGIRTTLYWILFLTTFLLGFVANVSQAQWIQCFLSLSSRIAIYLLIHRKTWLKSHDISRTIRTSFSKRKLVTHVRRERDEDFDVCLSMS